MNNVSERMIHSPSTTRKAVRWKLDSSDQRVVLERVEVITNGQTTGFMLVKKGYSVEI